MCVDRELDCVAFLACDGCRYLKSEVFGCGVVAGEFDIVVEFLSFNEVVGFLYCEIAVNSAEFYGELLIGDFGDCFFLCLSLYGDFALLVDTYFECDANRECVDEAGGVTTLSGFSGYAFTRLKNPRFT